MLYNLFKMGYYFTSHLGTSCYIHKQLELVEGI